LSALLVDGVRGAHTNSRIRGWLGRADQTTKVRAMFVHPSQVHEITRRHPQVIKARLVVSGRIADEVMTLHCEVSDPAAQNAAADIVATIRDVTKLRGEVQFAASGSLPNDGKIIDDVRDYS
jgi:phenylacetate-CoA ligase